MLKCISSFVCLALTLGCKTYKSTAGPVESLESGLYFNHNLFVTIDNELAYPEYFDESSDHVSYKVLDTLRKENDSLYAGRKYFISLRGQKMYINSLDTRRGLRLNELQKADEEIKKRWDKLHNRWRLYQLWKEYIVLRNKLKDTAFRKSLDRTYKGLRRKLNMPQQSFKNELIQFRKDFLGQ